jgi:hypothetical protein
VPGAYFGHTLPGDINTRSGRQVEGGGAGEAKQQL